MGYSREQAVDARVQQWEAEQGVPLTARFETAAEQHPRVVAVTGDVVATQQFIQELPDELLR